MLIRAEGSTKLSRDRRSRWFGHQFVCLCVCEDCRVWASLPVEKGRAAKAEQNSQVQRWDRRGNFTLQTRWRLVRFLEYQICLFKGGRNVQKRISVLMISLRVWREIEIVRSQKIRETKTSLQIGVDAIPWAMAVDAVFPFQPGYTYGDSHT